MAGKKCILFDFDGVIADSYKSSFAVAKIMHPMLTEKIHKGLFDGNVFDTHEFEIVHTEDCKHDIDYYAEYGPHAKEHSRLIRGMDTLIRELASDYALFVISSCTAPIIQDFLERNGLSNIFTDILGEESHRRKDEKIRIVFERYGFDAARAVFVTDTLGDIREARTVGVDSIGVSWGFQRSENLKKGDPFRIVDTPEELSRTVRDYFFTSRE